MQTVTLLADSFPVLLRPVPRLGSWLRLPPSDPAPSVPKTPNNSFPCDPLFLPLTSSLLRYRASQLVGRLSLQPIALPSFPHAPPPWALTPPRRYAVAARRRHGSRYTPYPLQCNVLFHVSQVSKRWGPKKFSLAMYPHLQDRGAAPENSRLYLTSELSWKAVKMS